jgi:1,4-alpha-glucan branching enzyme
MSRLPNTDFFEAQFPTSNLQSPIPPYHLRTLDKDGATREFDDPYRFLPVLGDLDLQLFNEGNHYRTYNKLGAHVMTVARSETGQSEEVARSETGQSEEVARSETGQSRGEARSETGQSEEVARSETGPSRGEARSETGRSEGGVSGVFFAVWAPNAERVSVIGDFNRWDGRCHPMHERGSSGIWEIFIPGLGEGTIYKYEVKTKAGALLQKTDPQGFFAEKRPKTASIVWDINKHAWGDAEWMARRAATDPLRAPMAIYEVHLGSWMRVPESNDYLSYRDLAEKLADYVVQQGYTHIELLPVTEHPLDMSWGYQVTGYFSATSRFGTPDEFQDFVDILHQAGIGVILDWVPAHFPKNDYGLVNFDGTALYEYADDRIGEHKEWGTKVFNYARNEVRQFLVNSALFWLDKYHIDGLRVDAVAAMLYRDYGRSEWLPNQYGGRENLEAISFLRLLNERVYAEHPGAVTIAEESTAFPAVSRPTYLGGLGFTFKWNMGWMHDTLDYIEKDPIYRKYHHQKLTFGLMYAFSENFILPISHDEVVHLKKAMADKMPGDLWRKFANLRLYYGFMWTHPGKKLLFMGQDFGQWREWSEEHSLDWHLTEHEPHRKLQRWLADLNELYTREPALYEVDYEWQGFEWIDANDWENSAISYIRRAKDPQDYLVVACNFTPVVREGYRVGVPELVTYREVLNSDSEYYFGSNVGNGLGLPAQPLKWQQQPYSIEVTLPPLAIVILKPDRDDCTVTGWQGDKVTR